MVFDSEPTLVLPLYVVIVNATETEEPAVFCCAKDSGGVHEMLVLLDLSQIVPYALPQLYVMVCVKLDDLRVTVNVCATPNVPLPTDKLLFRGIVVSGVDADADTVPLPVPVAKDA